MSITKRLQEQQAFSGKRSALERKLSRLQGMMSAFETHWPHLANFLQDYESPAIELRFYERDDGGTMALAKRQVGVKNQIIFAGSDDLFESLDSLNRAIQMDKWKDDKPKPKAKAK